eukprot:TRINITY_DN21380_c0_g1_i1.p1 TRINITY_DN21380_c0_g1~~TRINITY_DN21380_c0_g1_i1.p1  ORF type:complete len:122 (+),score=23.67 TRINITY_DN21380_c0_g1_i1:54-419(+)
MCIRDRRRVHGDVDQTNDEMIDQIEEMKSRQTDMNQADEYMNQMMIPDQTEQNELESELNQIEAELNKENAVSLQQQLNNLTPAMNYNSSKQQNQAKINSQIQSSQSVQKLQSALEETLNI